MGVSPSLPDALASVRCEGAIAYSAGNSYSRVPHPWIFGVLFSLFFTPYHAIRVLPAVFDV